MKPANDYTARSMAINGKIRAVACVTTKTVREICALQGCSPVAATALGRVVSGAALLGSNLKHGQHIAIRFEGNGPLKKLIAEADWDGALRGTVAVPDVSADSVCAALGKAGFVIVTKDLGLKEPYSGMVQLYTSEIAEDLAYYLTESEQIPSAVGLSASVGTDGLITASGGFLIQSLPPSDNLAVDAIMDSISKLPPLSKLLQEGITPEKLLDLLLAGVEHHQLESTELFFRCGCTKEKVSRAIFSIGNDELQNILKQEGDITVTCEFCKQKYHFSKEDLEGCHQG